MSVSKRLSEVYHSSKTIPFDDSSKIVIMSDCHRGDGSSNDNFSANQTLFFSALSYYYEENYTYIELGDGDELWENRSYDQIIAVHSDAFWLLSKFHQKGRLYMMYGNHDIVKKYEKYTATTCHSYFNESAKKHMPLFPHITMHEGLILNDSSTGAKIFLTHGHQGELINDKYWRVGRFLVRYVWRPFELIGIQNPWTPTNNYRAKENSVEKKLCDWAKHEKQMLIAGHTHHPVFPEVGEGLYFNDGSCVHPRCITAIEITQSAICLVKWAITTRENRTLYVAREILAGPIKIKNYANLE